MRKIVLCHDTDLIISIENNDKDNDEGPGDKYLVIGEEETYPLNFVILTLHILNIYSSMICGAFTHKVIAHQEISVAGTIASL